MLFLNEVIINKKESILTFVSIFIFVFVTTIFLISKFSLIFLDCKVLNVELWVPFRPYTYILLHAKSNVNLY